VRDDLDGDYYGVVGGAAIDTRLTERLSLIASATGGVNYLDSTYSRTEIATVDTGSAVIGVRGASRSDADGRAAYAGEVAAGLSYALGSVELMLSGTAEYLSHVPSLTHDDPAATSATISGAGGADSAVSGRLGPRRTGSRLDFDDLWTLGARLGVTARF